MEDLEYILERAFKEQEINDWITEVKILKQQHENECVKRGVKPNKNWRRKIWFRKDWYLWDRRHVTSMRELELLYIGDCLVRWCFGKMWFWG
jgi:hypothetical protein